MAENQELVAKIKIQTQELEELKRNCEKIEEENEILREHKTRLADQLKVKEKELTDKRIIKDNVANKQHRHHKDDVHDVERREKELDDWIKDRLTDLIKGDEERKSIQGEGEKDLSVVIPVVLVRYVPEVCDGDLDAFDKADPQEAFFKLNLGITFRQLKETACEFWKIDDMANMGLRASNYALLDLYVDENVHEKILDLRMPPEFWLFKLNRFAKKSFTDVKDCFIDSSISGQFKINTERKKAESKSMGYRKSMHKKAIDKMKGVYKGLESYEKKMINLKNDPKEKERTKGKQGGFITAVILFIILFITMIQLLLRRTVPEDFWVQAGLNAGIVKGSKTSMSFFNIKNLNDTNEFIQYTLGPVFFNRDILASSIANKYYISGSLRIRQVKTKEKPCFIGNITNLICYEYDYNSATKETSGKNKNNTWENYHSNLEGPKIIIGEMGSYDNSGYYIDFPNNINVEEFQNTYQQIQNTSWLNPSTRAIFITCNLYLPNSKQFVSIFVMVENNVMGQCYPSRLESRVIITDFYDKNETLDTVMLALEIVRIFFAFYFVYLYISAGLFKDDDEKRHLSNWFSVKNIANLFVTVMIIATFAFSFKVNTPPGDILQESYYDLGDLHYYYSTCILINAWVLLIVFFRIILIFRFSTTMNLYLYTLDLAAKNIIYYIMIIIPIIVGLCVLTAHMFGPFDFYYRQPKLVAISNMLFAIGYRKIDDFLIISEAWTIAFLLVYFFVIMFFLFSAFLGILMDSYRISELRQNCLYEALKTDQSYKPWKIWISNSFSRCKCKKQENIED
ncbi:hypothetical protein SteCoe_17358 [Stentor coeruleus]|uniref:Polycystin domain-containing protein n=1 Tax=Stentor coeruleus TaxID=5963 RepID=A0A1R2BZ16_9CILI|nr:hypothetical protein SteCoe_17358 [Stentor coeruleus]